MRTRARCSRNSADAAVSLEASVPSAAWAAATTGEAPAATASSTPNARSGVPPMLARTTDALGPEPTAIFGKAPGMGVAIYATGPRPSEPAAILADAFTRYNIPFQRRLTMYSNLRGARTSI